MPSLQLRANRMSYVNSRVGQWPSVFAYLQEVVRYRHLLWNLVGSDLRSRFRRSRVGIFWAMIQPLAFALMLSTVWGSILKDSDHVTFTIYVLSGITIWEYYTTAIMGGLDALINAGGYMKQSRIPFLIFQARLPLSSTVIFFFGVISLLLVLGVTEKFPPLGLHYLLVPVFFVMMVLLCIPLTIVFSVLGTQYRDTKHIVGIVIQGMFFITPVMLPREILESPHLHWLVYANPAVSVLSLFRDPLVYGRFWDPIMVATFVCWTIAFWVIAIILSARFGRRLVFAI